MPEVSRQLDGDVCLRAAAIIDSNARALFLSTLFAVNVLVFPNIIEPINKPGQHAAKTYVAILVGNLILERTQAAVSRFIRVRHKQLHYIPVTESIDTVHPVDLPTDFRTFDYDYWQPQPYDWALEA